MEFILEEGWVSIAASLLIALSTYLIVGAIITKISIQSSFTWLFLFLICICVYFVVSALYSNLSLEGFVLSSAKWGVFGVALLSLQKYRECKK